MSGDQRDSFKMPHAPPTKISESKAFREVRELVAKETKSFTFALSGAIPIVQTLPDPFDGQGDNPKNELPTTTHGDWGLPGMAKRLVEKHPRTLDLTHRSPENLRSTHCLPISLIWRGTNKEGARDLTELRFPLEPETEQNLGRLIADMAPATFGVGNRDVLDESYRKAGKMDADQFLTSFNPYEVGIVSTIAQYLLPGLRHAKQSRDVKVELYKLNVYSGPAGKFKAHVDTPRSTAQFGSLVVCLPLSHQGGALQVKHKGNTATFDWSASKGEGPSHLHWAAFYSDCEHEVLEVTEGHRLTLTYNLYAVRGNGQMGGHSGISIPDLPWFPTLRDLVNMDDGWPNGGYLGYHCSHVYPHSSASSLNFLVPDNLKGADAFMYDIFRSLGLKVCFRPTARDLHYTKYTSDDDGSDSSETPAPVVGQKLEWHLWEYQVEDHEDEYKRWTGELPLRSWEMSEIHPFSREPYSYRRPFINFEEVHWVNDFGHWEPQINWVAYGNQATSCITYSSLAMLVEIPPTMKQKPVEDTQTTSESDHSDGD